MSTLRPVRTLVLGCLLLVTSLLAFQIPKVSAAAWEWWPGSQVSLLERSVQGPALAYDSALGKMIMAWVGIDCCGHSLNLISSTDMYSWSNKQTLSLSASSAASCTDSLDMTYDPDNSRVYVAYLHVDTATDAAGVYCNVNSLYVFYTADGTTISSESLVFSTQSCTPSCGADNQMSGPSITYDSVNHRFVVANMRVQNIGGQDFFNLFTYTSTDGVNWAGGQMINVSPASTNVRPDIKFINGIYFLTYVSSNLQPHILQSTDLNSWTQISNPSETSTTSFRISYNPAEGLYHLGWRGTDSSNQINDESSSDAITWSNKAAFQSTQNEPSVAYNPVTGSLLMAWTGTDCCFGGSLNLMQYLSFTGGGGSGSVASGSLITMANGTKVPVQNVRVGDRLVVYNVPTGYQTVATVYQVLIVTVNSTLTIDTSAGGRPFRSDANPGMKMWVLTSNGPVETAITTIVKGDLIYNYNHRSWVTVTNVTTTYGGYHTMYDLLTTPNFTSGGLILEYIANGYPDCPPRGCKT